MSRMNYLVIGLPLVYLVALHPAAVGPGSVFQTSVSRSGMEVLENISLLAGRGFLVGLIVGLLRARLLIGKWNRQVLFFATKTGLGYGIGYGLGVALFATSLLINMATWGYPVTLESFGSGSVFLIPVSVPIAGFLAGGLDALFNGEHLGLRTWQLKTLWALTGLAGFSAALLAGDVLRGLPIGVLYALTMVKMSEAGVLPSNRAGVPG